MSIGRRHQCRWREELVRDMVCIISLIQFTCISVVECPLSDNVSCDDAIPHSRRLLYTEEIEGDLGACPEECHSNQRHDSSKRHLFQLSAATQFAW